MGSAVNCLYLAASQGLLKKSGQDPHCGRAPRFPSDQRTVW